MTPSRDQDPIHRPQSYGRRRGRPLRPARARLMETLLPRLDLGLPELREAAEPAVLFPGLAGGTPEEVWLEIGFGAGEHLAAQAAAHPRIGFLGAEVFVNGIASLLSRVEAAALENIRVFQDDARDLLEALPAASLGRVFVLFPDPWPKARHRGRRLIQDETLDQLARVLRDGAELRLATDDPDYLAWMLERATRHPDFAWQARRAADWRDRPADWPQTRYEAKALRGGAQPTFLRFLRRPRRP